MRARTFTLQEATEKLSELCTLYRAHAASVKIVDPLFAHGADGESDWRVGLEWSGGDLSGPSTVFYRLNSRGEWIMIGSVESGAGDIVATGADTGENRGQSEESDAPASGETYFETVARLAESVARTSLWLGSAALAMNTAALQKDAAEIDRRLSDLRFHLDNIRGIDEQLDSREMVSAWARAMPSPSGVRWRLPSGAASAERIGRGIERAATEPPPKEGE